MQSIQLLVIPRVRRIPCSKVDDPDHDHDAIDFSITSMKLPLRIQPFVNILFLPFFVNFLPSPLGERG